MKASTTRQRNVGARMGVGAACPICHEVFRPQSIGLESVMSFLGFAITIALWAAAGKGGAWGPNPWRSASDCSSRFEKRKTATSMSSKSPEKTPMT